MPVVYIKCISCNGEGFKEIEGKRKTCNRCHATGELRVPVK